MYTVCIFFFRFIPYTTEYSPKFTVPGSTNRRDSLRQGWGFKKKKHVYADRMQNHVLAYSIYRDGV